MERYKDYWICGGAEIIHPDSRDWRSKGTVLKDGRLNSIVEVKRLQGEVFATREGAEAQGLELCKLWVDTQAG